MSSQPPRRANTGTGSANRNQGQSQGQNRSGQGSRPPTGRPVGGPPASGRSAQGSGAPRPRPSGQPGQRPRPRAVQPPPRRGLRNSDLAFIFVGLLLVGALIWAGLQAANSNNSNAAAIPPPAADATTAAATPGSGSDAVIGGQGSPNYGKSPADFTPVVEGQPAPDFKLPDTTGQTYTLSQFKGKTVLLEFFATWCPHCQNDAPMINQLAAAYKDKSVQILGVNASPFGRNYEDQHDTRQVSTDDVVWFRNTFSVTFPLLLDPTVNTAVTYGVNGYPTIYIVNKDGAVASRPKYPFNYDELAAALDDVLKK